MNHSLEPVLWTGAFLLCLAAAFWAGALAALAILPWSALVWPLHRRRMTLEEGRWPPAYGVELWQTAVGVALLTLAAFLAAYLTDAELLGRLFGPVAILGGFLSLVSSGYLTFRALRAPNR